MKEFKIRNTKIIQKISIRRPKSAAETHKVRKPSKKKGRHTVEITVHEGISLPVRQPLPAEAREVIVESNINKANEIAKTKSNIHLLPKKSFKKLIWLMIAAALILLVVLLIVFLA